MSTISSRIFSMGTLKKLKPLQTVKAEWISKSNFISSSVAAGFETLGPWGPGVYKFTSELQKRLVDATQVTQNCIIRVTLGSHRCQVRLKMMLVTRITEAAIKKKEVVEEEMELVATLDSQFLEFAKLLDNQRPGDTISLYCSDYWMRQSKVIDDRKVTMTDTGVTWWKFGKTELNRNEWKEYLKNLCDLKGLNQKVIEDMMTNCGLPGQHPVHVPQYRDFFLTYRPKNYLLICDSVDSTGKPIKKKEK